LAYKITYKKSVTRDLKRLGKSEARGILDAIDEKLSTKPDSCEPLKHMFKVLRKLRVNKYRVVFAILDKEVLILRIGHLREVYRH
jgi:mRNA interferase RelE/StbE